MDSSQQQTTPDASGQNQTQPDSSHQMDPNLAGQQPQYIQQMVMPPGMDEAQMAAYYQQQQLYFQMIQQQQQQQPTGFDPNQAQNPATFGMYPQYMGMPGFGGMMPQQPGMMMATGYPGYDQSAMQMGQPMGQTMPVMGGMPSHSAGGYQQRNYGRGGYGYGHQNNGGHHTKSAATSNNLQKYKTSLCRHYESQGTCGLGDTCNFAHGKEDLRNISDPLPADAPQKQAQVLAQTHQQPPQFQAGYAQAKPHFAAGGMPNMYQQQEGPMGGYRGSRGGGGQHHHHRGGSRGGHHGGGEGGHQTRSHQPQTGSNYKVSLCKNFSAGHCKYGGSCSFAHGEAELKQQMQTPPYQAPPTRGGYGQPQPTTFVVAGSMGSANLAQQPQPKPQTTFLNTHQFPALGS